VVAQSGRRTPPPKPTPTASPTEPENLQLKKSSSTKLPEMVDGERIYTSRAVDEKVRIRSKPNPSYTRAAERHSTRGLVVLRAILAADETVKHIEVVTGLPDGLSEKAIEAARKIKFTPARKGGQPVSVWVLLEYRFYIS
jgi:TonB family protein